MSETETETKTEVPVAPQALRLLEWIKKSPEEIAEKFTVDCPTCPVSMQCQAGEGGSGRYCPTCGATATGIDAESIPDANGVYIIDCAKHNFERGKETPTCCDNSIMDYGTREPPIKPYLYILHTVHSKVPVADRLKAWNEAYGKMLEKRKAAEAK